MGTTVYFAPYVRGPEPTPNAPGVTRVGDRQGFFRTLIGSVVGNVLNSRKQPAVKVPSVGATRWAYRVVNYQRSNQASAGEMRDGLELEAISSADLRTGDLIIVEAGQTVLADGTILDGTAVVDESAVTGQSEPAVRSADGVATALRDSRVIAGQILIEVAPRRGHPLDWIGHSATSANSLPARLPSNSLPATNH